MTNIQTDKRLLDRLRAAAKQRLTDEETNADPARSCEAKTNSKTAFRTQKEAAHFVQQVQNELGSPNDKLRAMHKRYIEAINAR